jgi:hypothetical protein
MAFRAKKGLNLAYPTLTPSFPAGSGMPKPEGSLQADWDFPRSMRWYWDPIVKLNLTILPGGRFDLYDKEGDGWLFYVVAIVNNKDLKFVLNVYGDTTVEAKFSASDLYSYGLTSPTDKSAWLEIWGYLRREGQRHGLKTTDKGSALIKYCLTYMKEKLEALGKMRGV